MRSPYTWGLFFLCAIGEVACGDDSAPPAENAWRAVFEDRPSAFLRVWGTSSQDVYAVGADTGDGPVAYHFNGTRWRKLTPPTQGDLWWVQGVGPDDVRMVGDHGVALRYTPSSDSFEVRTTTVGNDTLFGVWGSASNDVWYVGGNPGQQTGVILHDDGTTVMDTGFAATASAAFFKAHGFDADAVWFVGQRGQTLYFDGREVSTPTTGTPLPLMGIHGVDKDHLFAVGGVADGVILAWNGTTWMNETPSGTPQMIAVWAVSLQEAYAAGFNGYVYRRRSNGVWEELNPAVPTFQDIHAVWVDERGDVWAVGGRLAEDPPTGGVLLHYGPPISSEFEP